MPNNTTYGPLIRFCLNPLIFTVDQGYKGVVAGIGVLILYPFISIIMEELRKKVHTTTAFYVASFIGVLGGTFYILSVGLIDWALYEQLAFIFPATMVSSAMIISWLDDEQYNRGAPFWEGFLSAVIIIVFACVRGFLLYGVVDLRFGSVGAVLNFGGYTGYTSFEQVVNITKYSWLSTIKLKGLIFFVIALLITSMGISRGRQR